MGRWSSHQTTPGVSSAPLPAPTRPRRARTSARPAQRSEPLAPASGTAGPTAASWPAGGRWAPSRAAATSQPRRAVASCRRRPGPSGSAISRQGSRRVRSASTSGGSGPRLLTASGVSATAATRRGSGQPAAWARLATAGRCGAWPEVSMSSRCRRSWLVSPASSALASSYPAEQEAASSSMYQKTASPMRANVSGFPWPCLASSCRRCQVTRAPTRSAARSALRLRPSVASSRPRSRNMPAADAVSAGSAAAEVTVCVTRAPKPATASWATRRTARAAASSPGWAYSSTSRMIAVVMSSASEPSAGSSQPAASPETTGHPAESTSAYFSTPAMLLAGNASVTRPLLPRDNRRPDLLIAVSRHAGGADL